MGNGGSWACFAPLDIRKGILMASADSMRTRGSRPPDFKQILDSQNVGYILHENCPDMGGGGVQIAK